MNPPTVAPLDEVTLNRSVSAVAAAARVVEVKLMFVTHSHAKVD
jgi:hypothetical protein